MIQQDTKLLDTITDRVNQNLLGLNDIVNKLGKMKTTISRYGKKY